MCLSRRNRREDEGRVWREREAKTGAIWPYVWSSTHLFNKSKSALWAFAAKDSRGLRTEIEARKNRTFLRKSTLISQGWKICTRRQRGFKSEMSLGSRWGGRVKVETHPRKNAERGDVPQFDSGTAKDWRLFLQRWEGVCADAWCVRGRKKLGIHEEMWCNALKTVQILNFHLRFE